MSLGNNIIGMNPMTGEIIIPLAASPSSELRVIHLRSVEELRAAASDWDDLWQRSEVTFPTMRAELLAQWIEHFAAGAEFHAIAVEQGGRWVAALPMVRRKIGRLINAGVLPCNEWSSSGECLLDPSADVNRVMEVFLDALMDCNWPCFGSTRRFWKPPAGRLLCRLSPTSGLKTCCPTAMASRPSAHRRRLASLPSPMVAQASPAHGMVGPAIGPRGRSAPGFTFTTFTG